MISFCLCFAVSTKHGRYAVGFLRKTSNSSEFVLSNSNGTQNLLIWGETYQKRYPINCAKRSHASLKLNTKLNLDDLLT